MRADEHSELARRWDRDHDEHLSARALGAVEADFSPPTWQAFRLQVLDGRKAADWRPNWGSA